MQDGNAFNPAACATGTYRKSSPPTSSNLASLLEGTSLRRAFSHYLLVIEVNGADCSISSVQRCQKRSSNDPTNVPRRTTSFAGGPWDHPLFPFDQQLMVRSEGFTEAAVSTGRRCECRDRREQ